MTKAALSTAGKSGPLGPLLGVDRGVGVTRDFLGIPGKQRAPREPQSGTLGARKVKE